MSLSWIISDPKKKGHSFHQQWFIPSKLQSMKEGKAKGWIGGVGGMESEAEAFDEDV